MNKISEEHTYKLEGYIVDIDHNIERDTMSIYLTNKDEEADVNNEKMSLTRTEAYKILNILMKVLRQHDDNYEEKMIAAQSEVTKDSTIL